MYYVKDMFDSGMLDKKFKDVIPTRCGCGQPLLLNKEKTALKCSDPTCPRHLAARMESTLKLLNVPKFGYITCFNLVTENNLKHPTQVLALSARQMPSRNTDIIQDTLYESIQKAKVPKTLADLTKLLQCEGLQTRAEKILGEYNTFESFYSDLDKEGEKLIGNKLNIRTGKTTKLFLEYFYTNKLILLELEKIFPHKQVAQQTLVVCMTGNVDTAHRPDGSSYKSREVFIDDMQTLLQGKLNIAVRGTITMDVQILITDTPFSGTRKNKKADSYNIKKVTFKQFQDMCYNYITREEN